MNREEAIECLSERVSIGGTGEQNCMVVFGVNTDTLDEAFDMAISALRQQETVTDSHQLNEPLTLSELRTMDGDPVWVQSPGVPEYGRWAIVEGVGENCLFLHDDFTCHEYGKTWLAYRQKKEV